MPDSPLQALYASLDGRRRPEDVAELVGRVLGDRLGRAERRTLEKAAGGSLIRRWFGYTSMLQDFGRPVGLEKQIATAGGLFSTAYALSEDEASDPDAVERLLLHLGPEIRKGFGCNDFKRDRLDRVARAAAGLELSKRAYNKRFRMLTRMEDKLHTLLREQRKLAAQRIGKAGLASTIGWEDFRRDLNTACFIAYYAARCSLRSRFTTEGQTRPFDEVAAMLFARCSGNWGAIAHVFPDPRVLARLSESQKGELLGTWLTVLQDAARLLEETWQTSRVDLATMVVARGNDSSTWNNTANAWNKARDNWIALLAALEMTPILDHFCPGKVMRLMAGDVAAWHRAEGGGLDPNTAVWRQLPLPWEVLDGRAECTREQVVAACREAGLDPYASGWAGPKGEARAVAFTPTPELVHGVAVRNAWFASYLKRRGAFSGT